MGGPIPYFLRNPNDDQSAPPPTMAPPVQMAAPAGKAMGETGGQTMAAAVNPFDAHTAPISQDPKEIMGMMSKMQPQPKVQQDMDPLNQQQGHLQNQLMADYQKDTEKPHGFWGHLVHGLGIAGDILRPDIMERIPGTEMHRKAEEQYLQKGIQDIGKEQSTEGLQGAQTGLAKAQTEHAQQETKGLQGGQLLHDVNGAVVGYEDGQGKFYGKEDPSLPQGVKDVMAAAGQKRPTNLFEMIQQQHPDWNDQQVQQEMSKPSTREQAQRLNSTWDPIAKKSGLPTGQFVEGMSSADVTALIGSLNNAIGKGQGSQRIVIEQQNASNAQQNRLDAKTTREYTHLRDGWDKQLLTYNQQNQKLAEANQFIGAGAMGDALGSIKALSGLAAGQGSGVRITQAELNSIAHARGFAGDFEAFMQKFGDGRSLTPDQEQSLKATLIGIQNIANRKSRVINRVLDDLGGADDTETLRKIDSQARHALMEGQ
jgi:hypothetical protein